MALRRRWAAALLAVPLLAAAPDDPAAPPKPRPPPLTAIADQLDMLAFDANPAANVPARTVLGRWAGPVRLFLFGATQDRREVGQAAASLARAARLPIMVVAESQVVALPPNAFVVLDDDLPGAFRGPLRPMLRNAFLDNEAAVEEYLAGVVAVQPCWTLPVWSDGSRRNLQAAVIGIDTRQKRPEVQHCIVRELAAALGLLGPGGFLRGSVFNPQTSSRRLSREDALMLQVLYGPALQPGMTRQAAHDAALAALRKRPTAKPAKAAATAPKP